MAERGCEHCRSLMAELALGVADARDRAEALEHLDRCPACRTELEELSRLADHLVDLVPSAAPPAGFESRVLAAIGAPVGDDRTPRPRPSPARRRRVRLALVATTVALALVAGAWTAGAAFGPRAHPAASVTVATLHAGSRAVGQVTVSETDGRPWLAMAVDTGTVRATIRCQVRDTAGTWTTVGTFRLRDPYGYWAMPLPGQTTVTGARLLLPDGRVLAHATLAPAG